MPRYILICAVLWIALGIPGWGWWNGHFSHEYPDSTISVREDMGSGAALMIGGPLNSVVQYLATGFGEGGWCITIQSCERIRAEAREHQ